jgi:hypothetical protein
VAPGISAAAGAAQSWQNFLPLYYRGQEDSLRQLNRIGDIQGHFYDQQAQLLAQQQHMQQQAALQAQHEQSQAFLQQQAITLPEIMQLNRLNAAVGAVMTNPAFSDEDKQNAIAELQTKINPLRMRQQRAMQQQQEQQFQEQQQQRQRRAQILGMDAADYAQFLQQHTVQAPDGSYSGFFNPITGDVTYHDNTAAIKHIEAQRDYHMQQLEMANRRAEDLQQRFDDNQQRLREETQRRADQEAQREERRQSEALRHAQADWDRENQRRANTVTRALSEAQKEMEKEEKAAAEAAAGTDNPQTGQPNTRTSRFLWIGPGQWEEERARRAEARLNSIRDMTGVDYLAPMPRRPGAGHGVPTEGGGGDITPGAGQQVEGGGMDLTPGAAQPPPQQGAPAPQPAPGGPVPSGQPRLPTAPNYQQNVDRFNQLLAQATQATSSRGVTSEQAAAADRIRRASELYQASGGNIRSLPGPQQREYEEIDRELRAQANPERGRRMRHRTRSEYPFLSNDWINALFGQYSHDPVRDYVPDERQG